MKLIIIDLDDTLCDTYHTLSIPQRARVENVMEERGLREELARVQERGWHGGLDETLQEAGVSDKDIQELRRIYDDVDVSPLVLFPGAQQFFDLDVPKVLITRSNPSLQQNKIEHLRIAEFFDEIVLVPTRGSKKQAIEQLLERKQLDPKDVVLVGDRLNDEIKIGNELGIRTILVRHPDIPQDVGTGTPNAQVSSLAELSRELRHL